MDPPIELAKQLEATTCASSRRDPANKEDQVQHRKRLGRKGSGHGHRPPNLEPQSERPVQEGSEQHPLHERQEQEGVHAVGLATVFRIESELGERPDQAVSTDAVASRWSPCCHRFGAQITKGFY